MTTAAQDVAEREVAETRRIGRLLAADGYPSRLAADVRRALAAGCCLWTKDHLVTSDSSRISELPRCSCGVYRRPAASGDARWHQCRDCGRTL